MRENYRQVRARAEVPPNSALIRLWRMEGRPVGAVNLDAEDFTTPLDPDLALFEASLVLEQLRLDGLFVLLEDPTLWDEAWGILHRPGEPPGTGIAA